MNRFTYNATLSNASRVLFDALYPSHFYKRCVSPLMVDPPTIGLVLGTGWGDTVALDESSARVPLAFLPGFETLEEVPGHDRCVQIGELGRKKVAVLSGRVHMNETTFNPEHGPAMVRMQIELLLRLGVKTLILTAAVGGLREHSDVGHVVAVNGLVTVCAGPMPMFGGEFGSPEDKLDYDLIKLAKSHGRPELRVDSAAYVFVRGPCFEGRALDKHILRTLGPTNVSTTGVYLPTDNRVVGMSVLPELCVASLYKDVRALALGYITNGPTETHSHDTNVSTAQSKATQLGNLLRNIVADI